ncbi:hypothetical protein AJ78_03742 [Emergomyces pasteurianus Ep9510]|uniref:Uncharacterized protein n=1 Tax=Emergomyces pasteurianus Ep9510 TaxID=1447872 RepID=A0A1J9QLJ5_9EURO|nr:hypothetical protein AJ78_03742 [Emergomyces pasteurianus Ep9510]
MLPPRDPEPHLVIPQCRVIPVPTSFFEVKHDGLALKLDNNPIIISCGFKVGLNFQWKRLKYIDCAATPIKLGLGATRKSRSLMISKNDSISAHAPGITTVVFRTDGATFCMVRLPATGRKRVSLSLLPKIILNYYENLSTSSRTGSPVDPRSSPRNSSGGKLSMDISLLSMSSYDPPPLNK